MSSAMELALAEQAAGAPPARCHLGAFVGMHDAGVGPRASGDEGELDEDEDDFDDFDDDFDDDFEEDFEDESEDDLDEDDLDEDADFEDEPGFEDEEEPLDDF